MSRTQAHHRGAAGFALPLLVAVTTALIAAPASAQSLGVKVWSDRGDGGVYNSGDPIGISVRTNRDAYLIVYEIDAEGAVHVLFPWQGNDTGVEGGTTLDLPEDPGDQLVVEGPVGEGYIVAIAADEPFRRLPWYLRPHDERADEMGYTADDHPDDGVTPDGKIVGDPFVAMERIRRQVLANPSDSHSFATAYTSYYVHHPVRYPRYLCNDCHRPGYWSWWDGFDPYYSQCSVFEFRVNANWWWGPTYWTTYVPYYAYVYRTDCPPRYRPRGPHGWFSSWDGWRRWSGTWGGPLRRYKSAQPAGYIGPSRWEQLRNTRGASTPLPPGFLASAHERPSSGGIPGAGIRRERRDGWGHGSGSANGNGRPWLRDGGQRGAGREAPGERRWVSGDRSAGPGGGGRSERRWGSGDRSGERSSGSGNPAGDRRWGSGERSGEGRSGERRSGDRSSERRWGSGDRKAPDPGPSRGGWNNRGSRGDRSNDSGQQQPNPPGREERPQPDAGRWSAPPAPAPPPPRSENRGWQGAGRSEGSRRVDVPRAPDPSPKAAPIPRQERPERQQQNDDGLKSRPDRGSRG